jgi:hypothetical protein
MAQQSTDPDKEEPAEYSARGGWQPVRGIEKLAQALTKAQAAHLAAVKDTANPFHKSKYADLASVWDAIRGPLTDNGLSVAQFPCEAPQGHVGLLTILMHTSGQMISERFYMPVKDPTNPQAVGSALTYARRYALSSVVGVCPEDDDGNAATNAKKYWPAGKSQQFCDDAFESFHKALSETVAKTLYTDLKNNNDIDPTVKNMTLINMADLIRSGKFQQ